MISGVRASSIRIEFDLVDDAVDVAALHHVLQPVLHVVAQIVEAVLVVGAVSDVAGIGGLALLVVEAVHDHADRHAEETVDLPHPLGVAAGEVVVDRDHMHALAGERVEVDRQGRNQRLALAGLHFGNPAFVQHHPAGQLHVEMALAERALGGLPHGRERRHQDVVERLAVRELFPERLGARAQRLVRELLELLLQRVDRRHARHVALDAAIVGAAEQLAGEYGDHAGNPFLVRAAGHRHRCGKLRGVARDSGGNAALSGPSGRNGESSARRRAKSIER